MFLKNPYKARLDHAFGNPRSIESLGLCIESLSARKMEPLVPVEDDELGGEEGEVKVSLEDFTVHGIVGEGEFGKVSADLS